MPQIRDLELAKERLKDRGIIMVKDRVRPNDLKPSQHDFNHAKVDDIAKRIKPNIGKLMVISLDDYIVDGHHRWLAFKQAGYGNTKMTVWRIKLNRRPAIWAYDDVSKAGI